MLGYTPQEVSGHSFQEFTHPEDMAVSQAAVQALLAPGNNSVTFEKRFLHKDGHPIWTEVVSALERGANGEPQYFLTSVINITERRRTQQAQKMESLGTLASGIAHDMNNVLGAILTLASAKKLTLPPDSPLQKTFDTISKAAERGGKMIRTLLAFARQKPVESRVIDLNALLQEEVNLLERTTLARIRLETELDPALPRIQGDPDSLVHALMNLCVNASDAMDEQGTLTLVTRSSGPWVEVQVRDTGMGMTPEVRAKALDPFFTTKPEGKGTGLGLPLVYHTVKTHGGELEIQSEPGRGTTVILRFPALATGDTAGAPAPPPPAGEALRLGILLVDDDELVRRSLTEVLGARGYQLAVANTGEEALERLDSGPVPDLVILDLNMPGIGGKETLRRLRTLYPDLPVLLATGRTNPANEDLASAFPRVGLIEKPFALDQLEEKLRSLVRP
jgi:PAS domain S-box-containing protein